MNFNEMGHEALRIANSKGWDIPTSINFVDEMMAQLMLVTTEVAEAAEAVRKGDEENFGEELADVLIRIGNITAACGIDMDSAVAAKMERNRNRPFKHGGKKI